MFVKGTSCGQIRKAQSLIIYRFCFAVEIVGIIHITGSYVLIFVLLFRASKMDFKA
jgi:hypothetical protein